LRRESERRFFERTSVRGSADTVEDESVEEDGQQAIGRLLRGGGEKETARFKCSGNDNSQVHLIGWNYVVLGKNI
jgi:hypothetical protein